MIRALRWLGRLGGGRGDRCWWGGWVEFAWVRAFESGKCGGRGDE